MTGTEQLTAVTQKHRYTLHTLKRGVSFSTRPESGAPGRGGHAGAELERARGRVEKAPPI